MPIFEYKCKDCGHCFEKLVGVTEPEGFPLCPKCGSDNCEKQFSAFAVNSSGNSTAKAAPSCADSGCGFT
ncbi:MAG: zinc ribbon domain-containing protein [Candidatus Zixiibacteriota bacterium]